VIIPLVVIKKLLGFQGSPSSWNIPLDVYGQSVRFILADGDYLRVRDLSCVYDLVERLRIWWRGFHVERVKRKLHDNIVEGVWIVENGDVLPEVGIRFGSIQDPWNGMNV
jgi:hypothetical protein